MAEAISMTRARTLLTWLALFALVPLGITMVRVNSSQPAAAAAIPSAGPAFGVQFHGMWSDYTDAQRAQVLDRLAGAGAQWVRLDLSWAMLQPTSAAGYDMGWGVPFADRVIDMASSRGLKVLVTLWLTPGWANGNAGERVLPTNPADYARVARWAAARWAGKVQGWEVWNEPNQTWSMAGADPAAYTRLLRAAYPAFHQGDPKTVVVFGGPSENDVPWISRAYAAGAHGYFDAMATHPYQGPSNAAPETPDDGTIYKLRHVGAVHDLMASHGDGTKAIWFTEFGWSSHATVAGAPNWEWGVTEAQQADYLVRTLKLLKTSYPYVTHVFWYNDRDQSVGSTEQIDNYGLLRRDLTPKPALATVRDYLRGQVATTPTPAPTASVPTRTPSTSTPRRQKWRRIGVRAPLTPMVRHRFARATP